MKKFCLICCVACLCAPILNAKTYSLRYHLSDFSFKTEENNKTNITGSSKFFYDENIGPGLPKTIESIVIPYGNKVSSYYVSLSTPVLIKDHIELTENPQTVIIDGRIQYDEIQENHEFSGQFPSEPCQLQGHNNINGLTTIDFVVSPFQYDADQKKLYFIENINIDLIFEDGDNYCADNSGVKRMRNVIKSIVSNSSEVDGIISQIPETQNICLDKIDYLLITSESLKEGFKDLIEWKKVRGVFAKLVTLEDIDIYYPGADIQEKIKRCIYDFYLNHDLKYVVIGGDNSIVPSRGCYAYLSQDKTYTDLPCDKYFGCFNGDFLWNADGDDIIGEREDDVDLTESVFISRVPIRLVQEAKNFVIKLIEYETGRECVGLDKSIVTAGVCMFNVKDSVTGRSDADMHGEIMYEEYIKPYWDGNRKCFYDTSSDFEFGTTHIVTDDNLQNVLKSNSMFFSIGAHGGENCWRLEKRFENVESEDDFYHYYSAHVPYLKYSSSPIILTEACSTNAFDTEDYPCLSSSFIKELDNSVVAYIGSSREGFGSKNLKQLSTSRIYEGYFYRYLFGSEIENKHLGEVFAASKLPQQRYGLVSDRFLQRSLNLIGDSEMPVCTDIIKNFEEVKITRCGSDLNVSTGETGCKISVISLDGGESFHFVEDNTSSASFSNCNSSMLITVSKQNYRPYLYMIEVDDNQEKEGEVEYYISGVVYKDDLKNSELLTDSNNLMYCEVKRNEQLLEVRINNTSDCNMYVNLKNLYNGVEYTETINGDSVSINTSTFEKGFYIVSLIGQNGILDSKKIML